MSGEVPTWFRRYELPTRVERLEGDVEELAETARRGLEVAEETRKWVARTGVGVLLLLVEGLGALTMLLLDKVL